MPFNTWMPEALESWNTLMLLLWQTPLEGRWFPVLSSQWLRKNPFQVGTVPSSSSPAEQTVHALKEPIRTRGAHIALLPLFLDPFHIFTHAHESHLCHPRMSRPLHTKSRCQANWDNVYKNAASSLGPHRASVSLSSSLTPGWPRIDVGGFWEGSGFGLGDLHIS